MIENKAVLCLTMGNNHRCDVLGAAALGNGDQSDAAFDIVDLATAPDD